MSNSTTLIDQISSTQATKEVVANSLFDAASPAMLWGRQASTTAGLTWGYYGGSYTVGTTVNAIANGAVTLTASATNYVYANISTGAVSVNTTGFPAGSIPLYQIVTGTTAVSSYTDCRSYAPSATASGTVTSVGATGGVETDQVTSESESADNAAITTTGKVRTVVKFAGGAVQIAAYTLAPTDRGACLVMNSSSAVSQALPAASGSGGNFPAGWWGEVENIGAGALALGVPSGASLDGVANGSVTLATNTGLKYFTDGSNWFTMRGAASGGGGGGGMTNPMTTVGDIITGAAAGTPQRLPVGSNGQVLTVVSGVPAWAVASGGGGGTAQPAVVQSTAYSGNGPAIFTLGATPTVGNILIAFCTTYSAVNIAVATGWTQLYTTTSATDDILHIYARAVVSGDTTAISAPYTDANPRGANCTLFEVSNVAVQLLSLTNIVAVSEENTSSISLGAASFTACLAIGQVSTTGANPTPAITGATATATTAGTSTNASPRAVTGFSTTLNSGGTVSVSASFGSAVNNYGLMLVVPAFVDGMLNPMNSSGDIIIGGSGGTAERLGAGTAGQVLTMVSGAPAWATVAAGDALNFAAANRYNGSGFSLQQYNTTLGTLTALASGRGFVMYTPNDDSTGNTLLALEDVPSATNPWTITALLNVNMGGNRASSYSAGGIYVTDTSGAGVFFGWDPAGSNPYTGLGYSLWNSIAGFNSRIQLDSSTPPGVPLWMRLIYQGSGGNFVFQTSVDGETWLQRLAIAASAIGTLQYSGLRLLSSNRGFNSQNDTTLTCFHYAQG